MKRLPLILALMILTPWIMALTLAGGARQEALIWAFDLTLVAVLAFFCLTSLTAALSIARERDLGTLETLLVTRLTPGEVLAHLAWTRLKPVVLAMPAVLCLGMYACGPYTEELIPLVTVKALGVTFSYAWFFAGLGTWLGLRSPSARRASRAAYVWVGVLGILPLLVVLAMEVLSTHTGLPAMLLATSPVLSLVSLVSPYERLFRGATDTWLWAMVVSLSGGLLFMRLALRRVARPLPLARAASGSTVRDASQDAIGYREGALSLRGLATRLVAATLLVLASVAYLTPDEAFTMISMVTLIVVCLRAGSLSVDAFSAERENGTLESLMASRLTPAEICQAKWSAIWRRLGLDLGVLGGMLAVSTWLTGTDVGRLIMVAVPVAGAAWFFAALGFWCSSRARTTLAAGGWTFALMAFLNLVTFWIDIPLRELFSNRIAVTLWFNPLMGVLASSLDSHVDEPLGWIWISWTLFAVPVGWWLRTRAVRGLRL